MVSKRRKIEQDTVFSHENVNEVNDVDKRKNVITKDTKLVEDNEFDQVMEEQQHEEEDNVNKVNATEIMENVNNLNVADEIKEVITKDSE